MNYINFCASYLPFAPSNPFPFLLHPAFSIGKLTCMDHILRNPWSQASNRVSQGEAWHKMRGREDGEFEVSIPLALSLGIRLSLAASMGRRSLLPSSQPSPHSCLPPCLETSLHLRFSFLGLGVVRVLSQLALDSYTIPCTFLMSHHTFIISLLTNKPSLIFPNVNLTSISHWELTDLDIF